MAETFRFSGKILAARISKTAAWWFVSITVEIPDEIPWNMHPPVGIDVGLNRLATLSDGRQYENQRPLAHQLKKLRRLNKALARRTQGGKNWLKTKDKLGRLHYEIACIRLDWLHKLTTQIARDQWDRRRGGPACQRADPQSLPVALILRRRSREAAGFSGKQSPAPGRHAAESGSVFPVEPAVSLLWGAQRRPDSCRSHLCVSKLRLWV